MYVFLKVISWLGIILEAVHCQQTLTETSPSHNVIEEEALTTSYPETAVQEESYDSANCTADSDTTDDGIACADDTGSTITVTWSNITSDNITSDNITSDCSGNTGQNKTENEDCDAANVLPVSLIDQGILSRSKYVTVEIVCRYLYYPLLASAVCVNIINVIVYTDSSMKSPTSTYLIALSVNELLFSALSTVRPILRAIYGVDGVREQIYLIFAMYNSNYILASLRRLMYCLTVLVSTERFLAVAFPLRARNFRLIKSPPIFIFVIVLVCFVCHLPVALKFDIVPKPKSTFYELKPSHFYKNNKDFVTTVQLANRVIYVYLVLLLGLMMNLFVLVALKMHTKNRQKMNTSVDAEKAAKRERQTTITILTSSFLFTILALPLATDAIVSNLLPDYGFYKKEHYVNMLMKDINGVLVMFSLSTDFIFYMLLSKAYRRTFFRRIPFMATIFRRQKYLQESVRAPQTNVSNVSVTDSRQTEEAKF